MSTSKSRRPSTLSLLIYAGMLLVGISRTVGPYSSEGWTQWWGVLLIVWGGIGLALGWFVRILPATTPEEAAENTVQQQKALYSGTHVYRAAGADDFAGLDSRFYEDASTILHGRGFRYLGDIVNVTAAESMPGAKAVLRVFVSADGATGVAAYHLRFSGFIRLLQFIGLLPRGMKMFDIGSELSDGLHVVTSNSAEADKTSAVPGIDREQHPMATPLEQLLELHEAHLRAALTERPQATPIPFRTMQDVLASENRQQMLKVQFKQQRGYLDEQELRQISGKELTDLDREYLARVREKEREAAGD